jgi:hypothetical protein
MRRRVRNLIFIVPAAIVGVILFVTIGGGLVMLLWNWLLPPLFAWKAITFWQAVGLLALCRILFGRSGFGRGGRPWRRGHGGWSRMTPEEREKWRETLRERWIARQPPRDSPVNP